jgi:hypothetical protein
MHSRDFADQEIVLGVQWEPFNNAQKAQQTDLLDNVYIEALRQLAPDMGAYVNEVCLLSQPMKLGATNTV